jgi:hypothetical protein
VEKLEKDKNQLILAYDLLKETIAQDDEDGGKMTPEERAKMYCERIHLPDEDFEYLSKLIREEEREAIAKFIEDGANGFAGKDFRYEIAREIRARGEK